MAVVILAGYFSSKITFEEDISKMLPVKNAGKMNFVIKNLAFADKLIVNISLSDTNATPAPEKLIAFTNELVDTLQNSSFSPFIKEVFYKVTNNVINEVYTIIYENLPVFLDEKDYTEIDSLITEQAVNTAIKSNYKKLISPAGFALKKYIIRDPLGISAIVLKKLQSLQFDGNFEIVNGYIFTKDKRNLLLFITTSNPVNETSKNTIFIETFDNALRNISNKTGNVVNAEYFGAVAVSVCNAQRIKKDIILTITIALIVLMVLISLYFRRVSVFLFIFLPAIFGGGVSLALMFLIKSQISLIALSIGAVLLGITVDYSLHIFTHFRHKNSVKETLKDISLPIIMSSLTTASAFLCLVFVSSETLHELGLFAALSVITAALFSLIVLPHLLKIPKLRDKQSNGFKHRAFIDKFTSYRFDKNKILISLIVIFSIVFFFSSKYISFESDMEKMSYVTGKLAQTEKTLDKISNYKLRSVYLACTGKDLNQALIKNEKLQEKIKDLSEREIVKKYTSVSTLLISGSLQQERIKLWNQYWNGSKKQNLKQQLITSGNKYKFKEDAFEKFYILLDGQFQTLEPGVFNKIKELFFDDYITETEELTSVITLLKVDKNDKQKVYDAFVDSDDLIILDKGYLVSTFIEILKKDFSLLVKLSLLIVLIILILFLGRIELGIITFIPITLSWIWTLGIMGILGIKFNIFNIIISTLIFGLGIDYSIFIMRGLLQEYKTGIKNLKSYKTSILLSAITTITGIGVLIFASHPALKSIALVSIIGILSVVLMSYTIQPLLFRFLIMNKGQKRFSTVTFSNFFISIFTFIVFLLGCLFMTILLPVLYIFPLQKKNKKFFVNYLIMLLCRFIVYINVTIKKTLINYNSSEFKEPSIIISNHQSHLDLVLLLMLHPKIIILTNDWVWNNKFYGLIVRYVDFYPVAEGYEKSVKLLEEKVKDGYSIIVFPEGSRSVTGKINRFHKGAFYLADKLNLEILPVMIHGSCHCLTKGEVFLRSGHIDIKFFDKVNLKNGKYGNTYLLQAKSMAKLYREEYSKIKHKVETPAYFRCRIIKQYIYKGPILEWYLKIKSRLENNYVLFNELIPQKADIVDIGCGYGFMSYMLGLTSPERNLIGIDYDNYKIEIANNCFTNDQALKHRIRFVCTDISDYSFNNADVFVLSDVLHYMPEEKQEILIRNCIENLNKDGMIIIRDADKDLRKRHWGTKYTEFFSTRSGFNKMNYKKLFFISRKSITDIVSKYNMEVEIVDNTKYTSNLVYIMKKAVD
jgi:1-acyl-sn-glycerol-3-phosphate acyltransferase